MDQILPRDWGRLAFLPLGRQKAGVSLVKLEQESYAVGVAIEIFPSVGSVRCPVQNTASFRP